MIVAIPASNNRSDALTDDRFARCPYFCLFNTESKELNFIENDKKDAAGGVGPMVAELLAEKGVEEVWSIEVGPKAQTALAKLHINIQLIDPGLTIQELINK